ncbi:MAG: 30S ribosome-binding factor RbfA [Acidobacteria bacterium]|nr:30S ribosome-binding factor RbfA [Acidobacteriota bacterium]MDW7983288.1 30S ribosome-binding factor RbfA [Acidobacteriota bacterium]
MIQRRTLRKIASEIHQKLAQILLQEFSDPRLQWVTVQEVHLTPDGRTAYVIFDVLGDERRAREARTALTEVQGRLRGFLGKAMYLRTVPELEFIYASDPRAAEIRLRRGASPIG